jgi:hypothetical protein
MNNWMQLVFLLLRRKNMEGAARIQIGSALIYRVVISITAGRQISADKYFFADAPQLLAVVLFREITSWILAMAGQVMALG